MLAFYALWLFSLSLSLFFFNSLCSPFSIEFKVSIVISFQSELSKLHKKSDPRTPRLWVSISLNFIVEETYLFASKLSFKFQLAMETLPLELVRTRWGDLKDNIWITWCIKCQNTILFFIIYLICYHRCCLPVCDWCPQHRHAWAKDL